MEMAGDTWEDYRTILWSGDSETMESLPPFPGYVVFPKTVPEQEWRRQKVIQIQATNFALWISWKDKESRWLENLSQRMDGLMDTEHIETWHIDRGVKLGEADKSG